MNSGDHDHGDHARHCHGHHHHHGTAGRTLGIALVLTLGFSVVEFVAGWRAGSLALLADSGRMVSDGAALGLSALAASLAARPPSRRHTYGLGKAELLAALVNALSTPSAGSWRGWPASAKCTTCTSGRSAPSAWPSPPTSASTAWPTGRLATDTGRAGRGRGAARDRPCHLPAGARAQRRGAAGALPAARRA